MAMLIDADEFRERFDIDPDMADKRVTPHIGAASRRLKKWVGTDAYADALLETPVDADRKEDLQSAEAHLAYHFALLGLHVNVSSKGVLIEAQAGEGSDRRRYLLPEQIESISTQFLERAREIAEPYILLDAVPSSSWLAKNE